MKVQPLIYKKGFVEPFVALLRIIDHYKQTIIINNRSLYLFYPIYGTLFGGKNLKKCALNRKISKKFGKSSKIIFQNNKPKIPSFFITVNQHNFDLSKFLQLRRNQPKIAEILPKKRVSADYVPNVPNVPNTWLQNIIVIVLFNFVECPKQK